ncbi:unnamed protein product [Alopecurus aequalis]
MECEGMDALPEGVVRSILSQLSNARDVAACSGVSRCWRDCVPFLPALYFTRGAFDAAGGAACAADDAIGRMVEAAARLQELVIYCPFSAAHLPRWLATRSTSLRVLELRVDSVSAAASGGGSGHLDCIGLGRLHMLEIVGASLDGLATSGAVAACPNLTDLALLGCESSGSVNFALPLLQRCRLDFVGSGSSALMLAAPRVESLEVQGFSWIMLQGGDCLKRLIIAKNTGSVYSVGVDRLPVLEHLSLRGLQWSWGAVSYLLQCAAEVKHLLMKVEFCGDYDTLQPFPEVDLVEFFNTHPKLRKFEVHGAMFAALCQKNSLKNLDSRFSISSLEEVLITVRSPLNAEQKLITLESLLRYSPTVQGCVGWSSGSRR